MKKTTQRKRTAQRAAASTRDHLNRRTQRQILKTMAGAVIGGVVAGPVGVAAGAIVAASVRRGPVRKQRQVAGQTKLPVKASPRKKVGAAKRRPTNA